MPEPNELLAVQIAVADARCRAAITRGVEGHAGCRLVGACTSGADLLEAVHDEVPGLVILDAGLHQPDAFDLADRLRALGESLVVVVSADAADAVRAFEARALDFLPMPVEPGRLRAALDRAVDRIQTGEDACNWTRLSEMLGPATDAGGDLDVAVPLDRLIVRRGRRFLFLRAEQIDWIEAKGIYVSIHAGERSYLVRERMKTFENRLDRQSFMRIHRSAIVNLDHVKEIIPRPKGGAVVLLGSGTRLPMSRGYVERLDRLMASPPPRTRVV